jgi:membrane-bound serine protease (ClpP class)
MEFLLNPNTAYVLLVVGFVLTLLAILTPGTGMLEVGAFFCLALAAYAAYNIGFNPWALIVIVLSLEPFVHATRKPKRGIWLGISLAAMLISSLYIFNTDGWLPIVNPILALIISATAGGFIWLATVKILQAQMARPLQDLGLLIGQIGETRTHVHESGSAQVAGELWSVRSEKEILAGKPVRVVGREGFILLVEKAEKEKSA